MGRLRKQINEILEIKIQRKRGISFFVNITLTVLIFLNTVAIVLHTVPSIGGRFNQFFLDFEVFSVTIFTIEYLLRVWSCVERPEYRHWFFGRLRFIFSAWGIIDLLAIFPFFLFLFRYRSGFCQNSKDTADFPPFQGLAATFMPYA